MKERTTTTAELREGEDRRLSSRVVLRAGEYSQVRFLRQLQGGGERGEVVSVQCWHHRQTAPIARGERIHKRRKYALWTIEDDDGVFARCVDLSAE